ncbi:APC family permease [Thiorhodovibrio frisius]|uniref:Amino acid transporter n=1 Tax=Thiorhodovibrio frisius TaxID=631362 RepID=H8Z8S0_9GAMM|nr:amino acid permease [Thiorhodovibrio frisius]EIC19475.1 amino acid transporter [Thiorhodovibrio frisius]WPL22218.1 Serine/threonine exchanger SteT [Thiorhodovibrio frisius]
MTSKPAIGVSAAAAIVVANMIGTGVFTSLGYQVIAIKSPLAILALWVIGGLVALCGALVYAELGARMPRSGGEYHMLSQIYHPVIGFLAGFISVAVGFAAPVAAAAIAMSTYLTSVFGLGANSPWMTGVAVGAVLAVTLIHLVSLRTIGLFQVLVTSLKVILVLLFILFGFAVAAPQPISFDYSPQVLQEMLSSDFAVSLVYVMYAYSGWNAAVYILSEIRQPQRNLPVALISGTSVVMLLYTLLNAVFLYSAPISEMAGQTEVGYIAARHIFGETAGVAMSLLIAFGLISTISAMTWAGPRVLQTMGEDYMIFAAFRRANGNGVPYLALFFQFAIVCYLILSSSFEAILIYIGFTLSLSVFLTVAGIFVVRARDQQRPLHYLTWGYPWTPLIFLLITGWMLVFLLWEKPVESLVGLATVLSGLLLYLWNQRISSRAGQTVAVAAAD